MGWSLEGFIGWDLWQEGGACELVGRGLEQGGPWNWVREDTTGLASRADHAFTLLPRFS